MKKLSAFFLACLLMLPAFSAYGADGIVSMNTATAEELLSIPDTNMTREQAEAIVQYREKNGAYKLTDDLLRVPGMSNEVWQRMQLLETDDGDVVYDPDAEDMPTFAPSKC
jgi:competence ComEA-like helix-hairpin-helix protein